MSRVVAADSAGLNAAVAALRTGGLVGFPTDTVYGLGALATSARSRGRLWAAKRRPQAQPAILMVARPWELEPWVVLDDRARSFIAEYWPGALTLVLRATGRASVQLGEVVSGGTLAVRIPAHSTALALLEAASAPLATSSANRTGMPAPTTALQAAEALPGDVDLLLDGEAPLGVASSILDLSRPEPRVLREGSIPARRLLR